MSNGQDKPSHVKPRHPWGFYFFLLVSFLSLSVYAYGASSGDHHASLLLMAEEYHPADGNSLWGDLLHRVHQQPFNLFATVIFFLAILHTFFSHKFRQLAHHLEEQHRQEPEPSKKFGKGLRYCQLEPNRCPVESRRRRFL